MVVALSILDRSCNGKKIAKLEGQLQVSETERKKEKQEFEKISKAKDEDTAKLEEEIQELKVESSKIEDDRKENIEKDKRLENEIYLHEKQVETLTDPDSLADNWKVLAETWEKRFWNEREDKDKIIKQRNKWAGAYFKAEKKYWNEHAVRTSSGKQLTTVVN